MQKNSITNKITPCCGLPFSVIYWWVSNLTLNSEADRSFVLSKINQNGTIAIDGWKVLINSGTLEADASLTKADFLAWFDCGKQPTCEQLKLIIEGYKISNWDYFKNSIEELNEAWQELENKLKLKYNNVSEAEAVDIIQRVDQFTGENVNYRETTTWFDGSEMTDNKIDGIFYIKKGNLYFKRQFDGAVNAQWLGAKPNDQNFDNSTVIQNWWDNYAYLVGEIYFPKGNYYFSSQINLDKNRQHATINGNESSFIVRLNENEIWLNNTIQLGYNEDFRLKNVNIYGDLTNKSTAIKISIANLWTISKVNIWDFYIGIEITDSYYGVFSEMCSIRRCWTGILFSRGTDSYEINTLDLSNIKLQGIDSNEVQSLIPKNAGETDEDYWERAGSAGIRSYCTFEGVKFWGMIFEGFDFGLKFCRVDFPYLAATSGIFNIENCYFENNRVFDIDFVPWEQGKMVWNIIVNILNGRFHFGRIRIGEGKINIENCEPLIISGYETYGYHRNLTIENTLFSFDDSFLSTLNDSTKISNKWYGGNYISKYINNINEQINNKNVKSTAIHSISDFPIFLKKPAIGIGNYAFVKSGSDFINQKIVNYGQFAESINPDTIKLEDASQKYLNGENWSGYISDVSHIYFRKKLITENGIVVTEDDKTPVIVNKAFLLNGDFSKLKNWEYFYVAEIGWFCQKIGNDVKATANYKTGTSPFEEFFGEAYQYFVNNLIVNTLPSSNSRLVGEIVLLTTDSKFYVFNGQNWVEFNGNIPELKSNASINERPMMADSYRQIFHDKDSGDVSIFTKNGWKDFGFVKMDSQNNSTASDLSGLVAEFNSLLSKLKDSGLMK